MRGVVLLLAAGEGVRLDNGTPKAFVELCGIPLLRRAADAAGRAELVDELVVAVPPGTEERAREVLSGLDKPFALVAGGATRQSSAAAALAAASADAAAVAVHDAARALCPPALFDVCLRELDDCEAVCPAVPVSDTIKELAPRRSEAEAPIGDVVRTLDRRRLAAAQTPQVFRADVYRRAHEAAARDGVDATDDSALVERLGVRVRIVPGDVRNLKITTAHDLAIAEALVRA
ncbi:MAG: 2-C-methyl-D-erythritol 4-phosphate cytidylyltransferase [Actinomycetota bacterium]